jgi:catechol 2,3-dioxygenase-like lactoylglutathione lyase family enzyme
MTEAGIQYVEIGCRDLARSVDFYRGLLGFRPVEQVSWPSTGNTSWLSAGPVLLKLVAPENGDLGGWVNDDLQRGMRHVGMKVGDVDQQAERLRDAGVEFTVEPTDAVGDVRLAFFLDPDGTLLEFIDGHLSYHKTWSPELAERERAAATRRPRDAWPAFDHVAVTVADLDTTLGFYRDRLGFEVIGELDHAPDPRGFFITYLQAGDAVLEVFTYTAPTSENSGQSTPNRLGLREIGVATGSSDDPLLTDPDGIPLRQVPAG